MGRLGQPRRSHGTAIFVEHDPPRIIPKAMRLPVVVRLPNRDQNVNLD
jgi:hypothetical protein